MGIHEIPSAQVYAVLRSHPEGLSDGEVIQRLSFHGRNVLQAPRPDVVVSPVHG